MRRKKPPERGQKARFPSVKTAQDSPHYAPQLLFKLLLSDATPVSPPNWYDHWKTLIPKMDQTYYSEKGGLGVLFNGVFLPKGNSFPALPRGAVIITPSAAILKSNDAPPLYVYSPNGSGIDACGMVVTHEFAHKELHEKSWGGYADNQIGPGGSWIRSDSYDRDHDGIKDSWETANWRQPDLSTLSIEGAQMYQYWSNLQYDGNAFQTDNEFYADMEGGRKWKVGSMDSQDWANPGKQTDPPGY